MRIVIGFGAALLAGMLSGCVDARADFAAERAAFQKCLVSKGWCLSAVTDRISLKKTPFGLLPAQKTIVVHRTQNKLAWNLTCNDEGQPAIFLWAASALTYGDVAIRYRVDPAGIIGDAAAANLGNGRMFLVEPAEKVIVAMKTGGTLTASLDWRTESAIATFKVAGVEAVLRHINCGLD